MNRRRLLTLLGLAGVGGLAACAPRAAAPGDPGDAVALEPVRIDYGDDPSQYAELTLPEGAAKGVVVVIHGGFWRAQYDASLGRPLAASLAEQGWVAWNLEYRRVGGGGGYPATFDDVAAGIDALAQVPDLDLGTVITLGHSAGGHLAVWAAGRAALPTGGDGDAGERAAGWGDPAVVVTAAVPQAGVLDLAGAVRDGVGGSAVTDLIGGGPDSTAFADRYPLTDPTMQLPLDVPVRAVHGRADTIVPLRQSADYVRAASAAGADAELVEVEGDHFVVIDPGSPAWRTTLEVLEGLRG
ncbi:alpha/beta hydrolase family protein [Litorihabitans aurantiacus]|uniref:BD-FAE-like domain-containing protein n=1 Tax=Litorihabitans aurantiacus TaxID=1930061 RepID=A0AA37XHA8_9MICO|nr:alpha/beta hydrolase [Litorihabitans aurantiacus]GMA32944.1 hypothetical protein GCM10025875_29360 [Litorihabitans aurantiacus]